MVQSTKSTSIAAQRLRMVKNQQISKKSMFDNDTFKSNFERAKDKLSIQRQA